MEKQNHIQEASNYLSILMGHESLRYWELLEVVKKFNEANIPVMLIKGAIDLAIPNNRPPDFPPREMSDLDLLIKKDDWDKAVHILQSSGYKVLDYFDSNEEPFFVPGQDAFIRENPAGRIDLHYDLNKKSDSINYILTEKLWQRGHEVKFEGKHAIIPLITDQLWYQLVHVFHYHTDSLDQLSGISGRIPYIIDLAFYHRKDINWNEIHENAQRFDIAICLHFLYAGLKLKHGYSPSVEINNSLFEKASLILYWIEWAQKIPVLLTYASGRFTILSLFRKYNILQIFRYYFRENVKAIPKKYILEKYGISSLPFLFPFVRILHWVRLVSLHCIISILFCLFRIGQILANMRSATHKTQN
jgi:hypothetical protein